MAYLCKKKLNMTGTVFVDPKHLLQVYENKNNFSVFHLNARSTNNKQDELDLLFSNMTVHFDVIMFSETWNNATHDAYCLPGYNMVIYEPRDEVEVFRC